MPRARAELREGRVEQRRGAAHEQAHAGAGRPVEAGLGEEARVEGGDAHEDGRRGQLAQDGRRVEALVEQDRRRPDERAVERDE